MDVRKLAYVRRKRAHRRTFTLPTNDLRYKLHSINQNRIHRPLPFAYSLKKFKNFQSVLMKQDV